MAQGRSAQAAEACRDATERSRLLRLAAGAAAARNVGDAAAALLERSAAVATDAGHDDEAEDLARVAAGQRRAAGVMGHLFTREQIDAVLARARSVRRSLLRWSDVDFDAGVLMVERSYSVVPGARGDRPTKTRSALEVRSGGGGVRRGVRRPDRGGSSPVACRGRRGRAHGRARHLSSQSVCAVTTVG